MSEDTPPIDGGLPDPAVVQARAVRLSTGVVAPFSATFKSLARGFGASAGLGLIVGLISREPIVGAGVGLLLSLASVLVIWRPFTGAPFMRAAELYYDHDCHERAEWRAETGTPMPRGLKAFDAWLTANPAAPERASLLLPLGRLGEADSAIDAMEPATPGDTFGVEILRKTRMMLAGERPDLKPLHETWPSLPDPRERRHKRECLALLDAQLAVDDGRDPIDVLATARGEIDGVHWEMRAPALMAKWSVLAVLLVGATTLITAALVGW
jgi:hypothetical protein